MKGLEGSGCFRIGAVVKVALSLAKVSSAKGSHDNFLGPFCRIEMSGDCNLQIQGNVEGPWLSGVLATQSLQPPWFHLWQFPSGQRYTQKRYYGDMEFIFLSFYIELMFKKIRKDLFNVGNMAVKGRGIYQYVIDVGDHEFSQYISEHIIYEALNIEGAQESPEGMTEYS